MFPIYCAAAGNDLSQHSGEQATMCINMFFKGLYDNVDITSNRKGACLRFLIVAVDIAKEYLEDIFAFFQVSCGHLNTSVLYRTSALHVGIVL